MFLVVCTISEDCFKVNGSKETGYVICNLYLRLLFSLWWRNLNSALEKFRECLLFWAIPFLTACKSQSSLFSLKTLTSEQQFEIWLETVKGLYLNVSLYRHIDESVVFCYLVTYICIFPVWYTKSELQWLQITFKFTSKVLWWCSGFS